MEQMKTINTAMDSALRYCRRGLPVVLCDGKKPLGGNDWQNKKWTPEAIIQEFKMNPSRNVGVKSGPQSGIDIEADGAEEEAIFAELFAGCEIPLGPTYESSRGKHRWFAWDARLADCGKAVVYFRGRNAKDKLGIRIGAGGKAAQSIVPPSPGRTWIPGLSFDKCDLPPLPDKVVQRIIEAAKGKPSRNGSPAAAANGQADNRALERCRKYIAKMPTSIENQGGSDKTFNVACEIFRFGLSDADARNLLDEYSDRCEPPWNEYELDHKLADAKREVEAAGEFGSRLRDDRQAASEDGKNFTQTSRSIRATESHSLAEPISNATIEKGEDGSHHVLPLAMGDVLKQISDRTGGWPRRVDSALFVHEGKQIVWLQSNAAAFGWLSDVAGTRWHKATGCVTKTEVFERLRQTAQQYQAVEQFPHEPPLDGHYYAWTGIEPGNGNALRKLLDKFCPETPIDRDLIQAAMMTTIWGGRGGERPAFVFTAKAGRGVGKTSCAESIGQLVGGLIAFSAKDSIGDMKTRLLSPDALTQRVAMLDNVKTSKFSWGEFEGLITVPTISGKRMYVGEGARPNTITWFITLNGASLSTDMAQRSVIIQLAKPKRSASWLTDIRQFIESHRPELIADLVGALRADRHELPGYSRWASWERDVLTRLPEPAEAQAVILERQGAVDVENEEAEELEEAFEAKLKTLGYDTESDTVKVPSGIAAMWFNEAMNENQRTTGVSRILKQMHGEKRLQKIVPDASRSQGGRGFLWVGIDANPSDGKYLDLKERLKR